MLNKFKGLTLRFKMALMQNPKALVIGGYAVLLALLVDSPAYAGDLWTNATSLINDIKVKLVGISTAAATIGVATGALMKKLSMGKQQSIELGNKIIKDSIIAWAVVNGITLVFTYLSGYLK